MARAEIALAGRGRVLVRPSGTEPLVRVMVEAPTEDEARQVADDWPRRRPSAPAERHARPRPPPARGRTRPPPGGGAGPSEVTGRSASSSTTVRETTMCGIIAVARRPGDRPPPASGPLLALVEEAAALVAGADRRR